MDGGRDHTCALLQNGQVQCWGGNREGQAGDGTTQNRYTPVTVTGIGETAVQIATGYEESCAVTASGKVMCWGYINNFGEGVSQITGLSGPANGVAVGFLTICASLRQGGAQCLGYFNDYGQLGDGSITPHTQPQNVKGLSGSASSLDSGNHHACALVNGSAHCWGSDRYGQLGVGSPIYRTVPVNVPGMAGSVVQASAGGGHTCAVTKAGGVLCWGDNLRGQLGDGADEYRSTPVQVEGLASGVQAVTTGSEHTCALTKAGGVKCWGYNGDGQIGNGSSRFTEPLPQVVQGLTSGVVSVKAGGYHTCALTGDGRVKCWGANWSGQLGTGTTEGTSVPVNVSGLSSGVVAVEVGQSHNCAILQSGEVRCWGESYYGQTGDGATGSDRLTPVTVTVLQAAPLALALGGFHTCALVAPDNLLCWGANWEGQLGNGTTDDSAAPVQVTGLPADLTGVTAGTRYTCAYSQSGGVYCWGANYSGQAGDGTTENRSTATAVAGLASGVAALDAGGEHVCAFLNANGGVWACWGSDGDGQLGIGTAARRYTAVRVVETVAPELRLNYTDGKPGSVFSLTGHGYAGGVTLTPLANSTPLTATVVTTDGGAFTAFLDTADADPGFYTVEAGNVAAAQTGADAASLLLFLDDSAPLRRQEGGGAPVVTIPAGIAVEPEHTHLPVVRK